MSQLILDKTIPPSAPSSGSVSLYVKSDGKLYIKDETGAESLVAASNISSLTSLDYIDFDLTTAFPNIAGRMTWNDIDGTLNLGMKGGLVALQVGQEQLVRVFNNTGFALSDAQVIRITGSQNNRLTATLAQANSSGTSNTTFAVVTEGFASGAEGYATISGLVRDINTSAFAEGSVLYLSADIAGGITSTKPIAPNHGVVIGWCVRSHPSLGSIYVHVQNGYELSELHDVVVNNPQNNDILSWDALTGTWKNVIVGYRASVLPTSLKNTNYTLTPQDYTCRVDSAASPVTITLLSATSNIGKVYVIKKIDSSLNVVSVVCGDSRLIDGQSVILLSTQYQSIKIQSNGTGWDII